MAQIASSTAHCIQRVRTKSHTVALSGTLLQSLDFPLYSYCVYYESKMMFVLLDRLEILIPLSLEV